MLVSLSIRDIVLIDKLDLDWQPHLCTLTGETGAGKSILLDALGLATARRRCRFVASRRAQGSVTAVFRPRRMPCMIFCAIMACGRGG